MCRDKLTITLSSHMAFGERPPVPAAENAGDQPREERQSLRSKAKEANTLVYNALHESAVKGDAKKLDKMASRLERLGVMLTTPELRPEGIAHYSSASYIADRDKVAREDLPLEDRLLARARLLAGDAERTVINDNPELLDQIRKIVG